MDRIARLLGALLFAAGLGLMVGFGAFTVRAARDPELRRARLAHLRNPGNMLYEARYARRLTPVLALLGGTLFGFLAAVAGLALWVAGRAGVRLSLLERALAARVERAPGTGPPQEGG